MKKQTIWIFFHAFMSSWLLFAATAVELPARLSRGNLDMQLMYKAIFEMAADRADFVSMLFARPRPTGLTAKSTAAEIFSAFGGVRPDEALYKKALASIRERLTKTHGFTLLPSDLNGVETIYGTF
jgi:hypothetical protein